MNRRSFLTACIATFTAPAIVRAASLMPVSVRPTVYWRRGFTLTEVWAVPGVNEGTKVIISGRALVFHKGGLLLSTPLPPLSNDRGAFSIQPDCSHAPHSQIVNATARWPW